MNPKPDINEYVDALLKSKTMGTYVLYHTVSSGKTAKYADPGKSFPKHIQTVLEQNGVAELYEHQARAIDHVRSGRHLVLATPTASGKTLCYTLPVLDHIATDPDSRALYVFPLKALAQDQLRHFNHLSGRFKKDKPTAEIYDGDTPNPQRKRIREDLPHILMTNPEMIHLSILPYHSKWSKLIKNLKFVVVDEMHIYRGVFGAHIAQVLRRLRRICAYYHASPTFVFCSATVGNPAQLAGQLTGLSVEAIIDSTETQGQRHLLFLNAPEGPVSSTMQLLKAALHREIRTIVFAQSRKLAELITVWVKQQSEAFAERISVYRAGLTPQERRLIESGLASGELLSVVSTSALELGIDIGDLDLCILVGYPGSIVATRQRGGRAGRNGNDAAVILVAGDDALDQYFMRNPKQLVDKDPESSVVNPFNPKVLSMHLTCAASELPLESGEEIMHHKRVRDAVDDLVHAGKLLAGEEGNSFFSPQRFPQRNVDLRGIGSRFRIVECTTERFVGEIDEFRAIKETHPGAVYLHGAKTYMVKELRFEDKTVKIERLDTDYYTRIKSVEKIEITEPINQKQFNNLHIYFGRLRVTEQVIGYEKRRTRGRKLMDTIELDLPPLVFETEGLWFTVSPGILRQADFETIDLPGAVHAIEHAVIGILPLIVLADRNDFGGVSTVYHPQTGGAAIFIYDGIPGGAGLCCLGYEQIGEVLEKTLGIIQDCSCGSGCPSCVQSPKCGSGNRPMDKSGAQSILRRLLDPVGQHEDPNRNRYDSSGDRIVLKGRKTDEKPMISQKVKNRSNGIGEPPLAWGRSRTAKEMGRLKKRRKEGSSLSVSYGLLDAPNVRLHYGVFDIETQLSAADVGGWHKADKMRISCAIVYDSKSDTFEEYTEDIVPGLIRHLEQLDLVIGFNSRRFDYKVLSGYGGFNPMNLETLDILEQVHGYLGFRLSLNHLAKVTLGIEKTADGLQALKWWKEGRIKEIAAYCRRDVDITHQLFCYGREKGYLLFADKSGQKARIQVNW